MANNPSWIQRPMARTAFHQGLFLVAAARNHDATGFPSVQLDTRRVRGATMGSETDRSSAGTVGQVRRDPMAMLLSAGTTWVTISATGLKCEDPAEATKYSGQLVQKIGFGEFCGPDSVKTCGFEMDRRSLSWSGQLRMKRRSGGYRIHRISTLKGSTMTSETGGRLNRRGGQEKGSDGAG
jgi:hypothetical protein